MNGRKGLRSPVRWMLLSVACNAPLPLLVWAANGRMSSWLFGAVWYLAFGGIQGGIAQMRSRAEHRERSGTVRILGDMTGVRGRWVVAQAVFVLEWPLFAAAVAASDASVVTVVVEFWPVLFAAAATTAFWRSRTTPRDGVPPGRNGGTAVSQARTETLAMLSVAAAAVALVVLSEHGGGTVSTAGVTLAALAAVSAAGGSASSQMIGRDRRLSVAHGASAGLPGTTDGGVGGDTAASMAGLAVVRAATGAVLLVGAAAAAALGASLEVSAAGTAIAVCCAALNVAGSRAWNAANHAADRGPAGSAARINSLYYLTPVAALGLLALFADTDIARPDLLIVGAAGVVAVNMVMHLDPEGVRQRARSVGGHGYKAIVSALWVCGTLILLRDDWLPAGRQVWSLVEYWGMFGVFATAFALMFSFRLAWLVGRRCETDRLLRASHR